MHWQHACLHRCLKPPGTQETVLAHRRPCQCQEPSAILKLFQRGQKQQTAGGSLLPRVMVCFVTCAVAAIDIT